MKYSEPLSFSVVRIFPRPGVLAALALLAACSRNKATDVATCVGTADLPGVCPGRGVYDQPVTVELGALKPGVTLKYTLDGTDPSAKTGTSYTVPFAVKGAPGRGVVVLKAILISGGKVTGQQAVHSYVFPEFVIQQPAQPAGLPAMWGNPASTLGRVPVTTADYEMDPKVVTPDNKKKVIAALKALPTVSLTTTPDNLWSPETGIYMNEQESGPTWERPASMEFFLPSGKKGVQGNCGIKIQGGSSVTEWKSPKLSIEAKFKSAYGLPRLTYPLFDDRGAVSTFNTLIFDAHLNLTWIHPTSEDQRSRAVYIRDAYVADLQRATDPRGLGVHYRFVHLFLNGLYWGVYDLHERPDQHFAADYLGGASTDYDVLKHDATVPTNIVNGNTDNFLAMFELACPGAAQCQPACPNSPVCSPVCRGGAPCTISGCPAFNECLGLRDDQKYQRIQKYLDIDAFINYMIVNLYADNQDWDYSNWYLAGNMKVPSPLFRYFSWDAEWTLAGTGSIFDSSIVTNNGNVASPDSSFHRLVNSLPGPKPRELFYALLENPDFKTRVSKRADELLVNQGGALTPDKAKALFDARLAEFRPAVLAESARWGDRVPRTFPPGSTDPYGPTDFEAEVDRLETTFFPERSRIVRAQIAAGKPLPPQPPDAGVNDDAAAPDAASDTAAPDSGAADAGVDGGKLDAATDLHVDAAAGDRPQG